ncbi:hypothetical protein Agabi119p4_8371 [Agaricus bisporus var. burnettii]|uniref:Uncharacterized protein n=1 Tax=Agaricus bisporus var. burnettii TaxID=192524 RepID=A0A8H7C716_AGABI|nr:hypothetical protein Agabi119p4_8371 [Agaricus bisporus var. burnettii]
MTTPLPQFAQNVRVRITANHDGMPAWSTGRIVRSYGSSRQQAQINGYYYAYQILFDNGTTLFTVPENIIQHVPAPVGNVTGSTNTGGGGNGTGSGSTTANYGGNTGTGYGGSGGTGYGYGHVGTSYAGYHGGGTSYRAYPGRAYHGGY